jgi:hypothetical protein
MLYVTETWWMLQNDDWERKELRRIFKPKNENVDWRMEYKVKYSNECLDSVSHQLQFQRVRILRLWGSKIIF